MSKLPIAVEKIPAVTITRTEKHFGGRHSTHHYSDGTTCNVYSDFRQGDNPDPTAVISSFKKEEKAKKSKLKKLAMNTAETAPVTAAVTETAAPVKKARKASVKKTSDKKDVKEKAPRKERTSPEADKVIAEITSGANPLPEVFTEAEVHARTGKWTMAIYRWVRANCDRQDERKDRKIAYKLKVTAGTAAV